jgi:hypothetical protein
MVVWKHLFRHVFRQNLAGKRTNGVADDWLPDARPWTSRHPRQALGLAEQIPPSVQGLEKADF